MNDKLGMMYTRYKLIESKLQFTVHLTCKYVVYNNSFLHTHCTAHIKCQAISWSKSDFEDLWKSENH